MFTKLLVLLILFLSCQCQKREDDRVNSLYHSEITEEPLLSQRRVRVRKNAEPAVDIQSNKPEIFFCCGPNQIFHIENAMDEKCSHKNGTGKPEFPPIYTDDLKESVIDPWTHFDIRHEYPCKNKSQTMNWSPPNNDYFYILENGTIFFDNSLYLMPNSTGNKDAYCLANMMRKNKTYSAVRVCFPAQKTQKEVPLVYPITMAVSVPLLIATFLVYACLPKLRNIHGFTLMAYVACLCLAFVSLSAIQFGGSKLVESKKLCISLGFISYFSFLASFCWLNVMCFDIWWTYGRLQSLQGSTTQSERRRFLIYSLYAFGCASLLTGVCLFMDFVPGIPNTFKPNFGVPTCWFCDKMRMAVYFYGPMGITIICNIFLFISTASKIHKYSKDVELHMKGTDKRHHEGKKQWFNLYLKLVFVMGLTWSIEIISWFFTDQTAKRDFDYIWIIPDLMNTLQGVFIFIIFVCKAKVRRPLLKRLGWGNQSSRSTTSTITYSSTSDAANTATQLAPLQDKSAPRQKENHLSANESG